MYHGLLISSFWRNFDLMKQIRFPISWHFLENWFWSWSVDIPHFCHDCSMVPLPISLAFGSYLRGPSIHIHPYPFWMKVLSVSHYGVGSTRLCRTPVLHASLSSGSTPARPHLMTSVFTHSNHVFRDLPFFLVPGIWKFVIDFIQDVARRKWPYHQSRRQQRTNLMSSMPSFSSSATTIKSRDLLVHSYV